MTDGQLNEGDVVRAGGREGMVVEVREQYRYAIPFTGLPAATEWAYLVQFPDGDEWWYTHSDLAAVLAGEYA